MAEQLRTVAQVATQLGVSVRKVWDLIDLGRLPSLKVDASRRIPQSAVDRFIAAGLAASQPPEDAA